MLSLTSSGFQDKERQAVLPRERESHVQRTVSTRAMMLGGIALAMCSGPAQAQTLPAGLTAEKLVDGLDFPVSMAIVDDDTVLVTEKAGTLRIIRNRVLDPAPIATLEPRTDNESGLGGLTLAPDFATTGLVVVSYTPTRDTEHIYLSRVRLLDQGGEIVDDPWLMLPSRTGTDRHYSGIPRFGPDGRLYVSLGDLDVALQAQDPLSWSGSLLRFEADLSIPTDGPFGPDTPAIAIGFRNPYGLDVGPDGTIFIADNGGNRQDEVHRVTIGGNHGNPLVAGLCDGVPSTEICDGSTAFVDPIHEFPKTTGCTSVTTYRANLIADLAGNVLVGGWHSRQVHRFRERATEPGKYDVLDSLFVLPGGTFTPSGPEWWPDLGVTDVKVAPDGSVFVLVAGFSQGSIYRVMPSPRPEPSPEAGPGAALDASLVDDGAIDASKDSEPDAMTLDATTTPMTGTGGRPDQVSRTSVTISGGCSISHRFATGASPAARWLGLIAALLAARRRLV